MARFFSSSSAAAAAADGFSSVEPKEMQQIDAVKPMPFRLLRTMLLAFLHMMPTLSESLAEH